MVFSGGGGGEDAIERCASCDCLFGCHAYCFAFGSDESRAAFFFSTDGMQICLRLSLSRLASILITRCLGEVSLGECGDS